jgi:hypothetical protein
MIVTGTCIAPDVQVPTLEHVDPVPQVPRESVKLRYRLPTKQGRTCSTQPIGPAGHYL